ncbi:hypothetical protein K440DRAFT_97435 [Wilcoxina mikolae CBS 423.85]|nr:hypothetical protein K440DRAFT_97435 [Wilcoxina mikolae CBS 423.85]
MSSPSIQIPVRRLSLRAYCSLAIVRGVVFSFSLMLRSAWELAIFVLVDVLLIRISLPQSSPQSQTQVSVSDSSLSLRLKSRSQSTAPICTYSALHWGIGWYWGGGTESSVQGGRHR